MTVTKQQTYVNFFDCSIPTLILVVRVAERLQISNHGSCYDFAKLEKYLSLWGIFWLYFCVITMFRTVIDTQIHRALISRSVLRLNIRILCSICIDLPDNILLKGNLLFLLISAASINAEDYWTLKSFVEMSKLDVSKETGLGQICNKTSSWLIQLFTDN